MKFDNMKTIFFTSQRQEEKTAVWDVAGQIRRLSLQGDKSV